MSEVYHRVPLAGDVIFMQTRTNSDRRLLVVTESLGIGGTESHLVRLLVPLAERGWDVTVFCLTARGSRADLVERAGIQVVAPKHGDKRDSRNSRDWIDVAVVSSNLYRLMRKWRPHIAHFYLPGPYVVGAPIAIAAKVPVKIMSRRSLSRYQQNYPIVARVERLLHRHMDAFVGNSRAVVGELAIEGIPDRKLNLIYNGIESSINFPKRAEARRNLGIAQDALLGVMIANLLPYKGHKILIEALAAIAPRLPRGWRFFCAGRDEGLQSILENLVEKKGLSANVTFLGECKDVSTFLAAADFGTLSSSEEGFSNVILESMAAGLPMIATDVGGNREAVLDGETGLITPAGNPVALGDAVLKLVQEPEVRNRFGNAARLRVRKHFSLETCLEAHICLYEQLLSKRAITSVS